MKKLLFAVLLILPFGCEIKESDEWLNVRIDDAAFAEDGTVRLHGTIELDWVDPDKF